MNATDYASDKSYKTTGLLALFVGIYGGHRFYLGKIGTGILQLITFGGFGMWLLADLIIILFGEVKDSKGLIVTKDPKTFKGLCWFYGLFIFLPPLLIAVFSQ